MAHRIRSSIVLRTTLVVMSVAVAIGLVTNEIVGRSALRYEAYRAQERMRGLLAVVEPSASAACFVGDQRLAEETSKGLLNSPSIAAVEIRGTDGVLAEARRPGKPPLGPGVIYPLPSPFVKDQFVGEIRVYPDADEIARSVAGYVWALRGLVLLLAVIVGAALALTVMRTVVQPIKLVSDRLRQLDAARGMRLQSPKGHESDEIGRLVWDVNKALDSVEVQHSLEQQVKDAQTHKISSLGSLAGGVAHDFNNMLAGIMAYADLLLEGETEPERRMYLQSILTAATRSSELTAKLLAFGRRGKNRLECVVIQAAMQECLLILHPSMHPDLQVTTDLEEGLCVDGDPSQIQQVLMNLCLNAIEAMPNFGVLAISTRRVQLDDANASNHRLPPGPYVRLEISDTGPGISDDVLPRIFEPFFTTKTQKDEMGTGLGLSTVYGIVEAHQGAIDVISKVGAGSTFQVFLPLGRITPVKQGSDKKPGSGSGVILVVEDEPILRDVARVSLESLGYSVETADHGRSGVAAYHAMHDRLTAVLLDLKMPVMGGLEAFTQIRQIDASVPVIICTGYGENEEVQGLLSSGAAGLLSKPYRIRELSEALQKIGMKNQ